MLKLTFNVIYKTLDLSGKLPVAFKSRLLKEYTYNPILRVYQSRVTRKALNLALKSGAILDSDDEVKIEQLLELNSQELPSKPDDDVENNSFSRENREEDETIGYIIVHPVFGLGRILSIENRFSTVDFFFPPSQLQLTSDSIRRARIPVGTPCETTDGRCTVKKHIIAGQDYHRYIIEYDNELVGELSETELTPIKLMRSCDPMQIMATCQQESYSIFVAREKLVHECIELVRRSAGVKALLSSRIDLHSHQAYVVGTVILDDKQRYLLADEVGLGKTIEAGVIIHDLLARNPHAKILILCPGALIQQWFSEMYSKFSGIIFRLPELSGINLLTHEETQQVILSFHMALANSNELIGQEWDLVVIDEVHHLLQLRSLYKLVRDLSLQNSALLLLSALPVQHRDQEYYDLLALLEPKKYRQDDQVARDNFSKLFDRQKEIGGRIGVINRRLSEIQNGELDQVNRVLRQLESLVSIPVLRNDQFIKESIDALVPDNDSFVDEVHQIIHHISDFYRINRRILRNRRKRLIESEQLNYIERVQHAEFYQPDQYEIDALSSVESLLRSLSKEGLREEILLPFTMQLTQACVYPAILVNVLKVGEKDLLSSPSFEEFEELGHLVSYSEWNAQVQYYWSEVRKLVEPGLLKEAIQSAESWESQGDIENIRLQRLISLLDSKHRANSDEKFILFAGYPNLAELIGEQVSDHFGKESIALFHFGMHSDASQERVLKEKEATRFRSDKRTWLLVCDETGGEGRNFQFAAELIHYDLPWQVSKIEQRIGRLDRMGRDRPDVVSNLIIAEGQMNEAWYRCLSDGLGVFNQSISGLEFALRDIELDGIRNLLSNDDQALWDMPLSIKERVENERALDESQNQTDEASYERVKAEEFRRVQSTTKSDKNLAIGFVQYIQQISDRGSVRFIRDIDYPKGIFEFFPEDVRLVQLDLQDTKKPRKGTFDRKIAQNRPDLEFFSVGNDFFDSVCKSLFVDPTGKTYAVECRIGLPVWCGFEFAYRIKPSVQLKDIEIGYRNLLDHLFAQRVQHCFIHENGNVTESTEGYLALRKSFVRENKGRIWNNITSEKASFLLERYSNWEERIRNAEEVARVHVHQHYVRVLESRIEEQINILDERIRKLEAAQPDDWDIQTHSLQQLRNDLPNWELELDSVGFLSINGGILGV